MGVILRSAHSCAARPALGAPAFAFRRALVMETTEKTPLSSWILQEAKALSPSRAQPFHFPADRGLGPLSCARSWW